MGNAASATSIFLVVTQISQMAMRKKLLASLLLSLSVMLMLILPLPWSWMLLRWVPLLLMLLLAVWLLAQSMMSTMIKQFAGPTAHRRVRPGVGCVWKVPRPRKVGGPGPSAAEVRGEWSGWIPANLPQCHGDLVFAMDPVDAFTITP